MVFPARQEHKLFPVIVREYMKPEDDLNEKLIEFFKSYPQAQTNIPEGVITGRPDLQKCANIHVKRLIEWLSLIHI